MPRSHLSLSLTLLLALPAAAQTHVAPVTGTKPGAAPVAGGATTVPVNTPGGATTAPVTGGGSTLAPVTRAGGPPAPTPQPNALPAVVDEGPLQGTWRFQGKSRTGRYGGTIQFVRRGPEGSGAYSYTRRWDPAPGTPAGKTETGTATLAGTHLHTKQQVLPGMLQTMGPGNNRSPLRHGFYRLRNKNQQARGFTYVPASLRAGAEQLFRIGPNAQNNHVQLLVDGTEFFTQLHAELMAATRSIHMQTFIFTDDQTGKWVGELLAKKAAEGVQVRLLCDDYGTWISDELMAKLRGAGAEVILQHSRKQGIKESLKNIGRDLWDGIKSVFGADTKRKRRGVFNHDHRKIITVDGRVGFIGGMNINRLYEFEWHDIHSRVEGNVVKDMEKLFFESWKDAGGKVVTPPQPDPRVNAPGYWPGNMKVDLVRTTPGVSQGIKNRYLAEIHLARRKISIENAYFLNSDIINALKKKAQAGVQTIVIIPADDQNDVSTIVEAFKWVQNDIVRAGIQLYKYRGRMTHGKVATFDGLISTVGSCNLDDLALEKLYEANLFITSVDFTKTVDQRVFKTDIPKSDRVQEKKIGFWKKAKAGLLHMFRGFM